jgi:tRNA(Ile)-lysidine synthase
MLSDFKKYIGDNNLVRKGDNVLLALSGGIDSMVMADLFLRAGIKTGAAHCNFCLRDNESDEDEEFVRSYAESRNIPFHSVRFNTRQHALSRKISIQMAARELRYEWFELIRKQHGYNSTAVAHNMNDNIETLILNITRGSGIAGLTGIKPINNNVIRPLLFATRYMIIAYSNKYKIRYREDKSNAEIKYTRNKIRHLVIPVLREINPAIEVTLNNASGRLNDINDIATRFARETGEKIFSRGESDVVVADLNLLIPYLENRSLIYELFKQFGITDSLLTGLFNVIRGRSGARINTLSHRLFKNRHQLIISPGSTADRDREYSFMNISDMRVHDSIRSTRKIKMMPGYTIPKERNTACLDYQKISFPLLIRKWNPGDYFYPFGFNHRKKLSDYFIDRKWSVLDKEKAEIIESGGRIVWIIGERIDNRFRVTDTTTEILLIKAR